MAAEVVAPIGAIVERGKPVMSGFSLGSSSSIEM